MPRLVCIVWVISGLKQGDDGRFWVITRAVHSGPEVVGWDGCQAASQTFDILALRMGLKMSALHSHDIVSY